jgi:two-component system, chemotaxis family, protein-glutamate methylesterase/glutaminase
MASTDVEKRDTIVLGASAGGIEALQRLLPAFAIGCEASVIIVVHLPADGHSALDLVLSRATALRAAFAEDDQVILHRHVYIAPPDRHLVVHGDRLRLLGGPRENRCRPAIDPLFRSAAVARRGRVMGAVLSGLLDDGAAGLLSVKRCGGLAYVQASVDALACGMPECAARALGAALDGVLGADALGSRLASLVGTLAPGATVPKDLALELTMLESETAALDALVHHASPLSLGCPECGGPLWGVVDGRLRHGCCPAGHEPAEGGASSEQGLQIEQALWAAILGLEQRSKVLRNLAREEGKRHRPMSASLFESEALLLGNHASTLRGVLDGSLQDRPRVR